MSAKPTNPYQTQKPICDPRMFFGPASVLRKIFSALAINESISLVGLRHSGKTTLLCCMSQSIVQDRLEYDLRQHFFVYIDVRNCLRKTCEDFFDFVSEEIIASSHRHFEISFSSKTGEDKFIDILKHVRAQGFHTVLLLDAFDDITRNQAFDPEFFMFLRAQASAGLVSYITASVLPLNQICHPAIQGSPFFNIFGVCQIKPLALEEARELVTIPSLLAGYPFTKEEIEWVLKLSGRHPFFIQRVCYYLFEEKSQQRTVEVSRKRIVKQTCVELFPHFEYLWNELSTEQQELLKEEAQRQGLSERPIPELSESWLFRKYVRDLYHLSFVHMSEDVIRKELKEVLKHLDSLTFLANSRFRHLKLVATRIEYRSISSNFEKGKIIREVLNEALERLQGEGTRTNTDPAWLLYNVLSYTYFNKKNGFNQVGIADRLGISLRQYHREKDEAIQALGDCLLEMDTLCSVEDEE